MRTNNNTQTIKSLKAMINEQELQVIDLSARLIQVYVCDQTGNEYDVIISAERDIMTGRYYFITREGARVAWSRMPADKLATAAADFADALAAEVPAEEVENVNECTTVRRHVTAERVAEICKTFAEAVALCFGSSFPVSDMSIDCRRFAKWVAGESGEEFDPDFAYWFAIRKQGSESGRREYVKERCSHLGAPVYVLKVEREQRAGLFTLSVRVSSPATADKVAGANDAEKTAANADRIEAERTANRSAEFLAAFKAQAMKATKKAAQATAKAAGRVALRVFRVLWFVAILAASVATMFGCGYALGTVTPHSLPVLLRILVFFVCVGAPALFVEYVLLRISKAMDNATGRRLFAMS